MVLFSMQFTGNWDDPKSRKWWLEKIYPKILKSCQREYKNTSGIVYKKGVKFLAVHKFAAVH